MFINVNDKIVNLSNVSNINIITQKNRIVLNLNYTIEIDYFNNKVNLQTSKLISDYIYWDSFDYNDMNLNMGILRKNKYFKENFIKEPNNKGFINKNTISSVKFSELKHRIIFNLSNSITFFDSNNKEKITSEFIYVNCENFKQYSDYCEYVKQQLIQK